MGTHPIFESDFDCLTEMLGVRLVKNSRRFLAYSNVQVSENTDGFEILINSRKLRVPRTSEVVKVKSRDIAEIVALEWAGQKHRDLTMIQKHTLYMTQLCFAEQELSETADKASVIEEMLKYLQTDTCLFRSPVNDSLESLDGSPGAKLCDMQNGKCAGFQTTHSATRGVCGDKRVSQFVRRICFDYVRKDVFGAKIDDAQCYGCGETN